MHTVALLKLIVVGTETVQTQEKFTLLIRKYESKTELSS